MRSDRRRLLKVGASAVAGVLLGGGMALLGSPARRGGSGPADELVPTRCGQCGARCGLVAHIRDGRVTKLEIAAGSGRPEATPCPRGLPEASKSG